MAIVDWTNKITEITLFVEDLHRSKAFYQETFKLAIIYEDESCAVFDYGNTSINLLNQSNARELIEPAQVGRYGDGARFQFTIQVPDVDRVCDELEALGVKLLNGPITRPWGGERLVLPIRTGMCGRLRSCCNELVFAERTNVKLSRK